MLSALTELSTKGGRFEREFRIVRRTDGAIRFVQGAQTTINDSRGRPLRMVGVNVDVTQRRETEAAVIESEARFRMLADAPVGVFETDPAGRCQFVNARWLAETGLTAEQVEAVLNAPGKLSNADGVYLFPPPQLILDITPEVRSKLYATLRKIPANEYHVDPVLILNDDAEKWFTNSGLRPEIIDMIDKLSYKRSDLTAFSDLSLLMNLASGESEGRQILKAMTRTRSLILRMIITNHSEVDENMKYWTTGLNLRRKDVVPMLHSVIETQGVEKLDILHLLPALPRKLLYTYPDPSMGAEGIFPDCHWTTLNFFNYNGPLSCCLMTRPLLGAMTTVGN
jgi:hypothetical protein